MTADAILQEEFARRGCACPVETEFRRAPEMPKDHVHIAQGDGRLTVTAQGLRGHIYGIGRLLRCCELREGKAHLCRDISGYYAPELPIRGHQLGYRANNNTYDAWSPQQFRRYCLDLMYFGVNTLEQVPDEGNNTGPLMQLPPNELLVRVSAIAAALDLDFGLWYPINSRQPEAEAAEERRRIFRSLPRLDYLFIPGADPGDLPPEALFARGGVYSALLREAHPHALTWISAQMPHNCPDWPDRFAAQLAARPPWLHGVIMGPNHAYPLEQLRRVTPACYALRFYPDLSHSLRCEYPVHFEANDWHFALAATLSRESVNPRPLEFQRLHSQTRGHLCGSVSYSEGVHDDCNKVLWSALDWCGDTPPTALLQDYARLFFWGAPPAQVAEGLLALEQNWYGDPAQNPGIDRCLALWEELLAHHPALGEHWRFNLHLLRARCDAYVRHKRRFELEAIARGDFSAQYPPHTLRPLAATLFAQIGIQLDVAQFGGLRWERGCTLDTIDRPVTDLLWLRRQTERGLLKESLQRNCVAEDEFYFSFALHDRRALGCDQEGEFYLNFQGDRPCNDGTLPCCLFQVYDHVQLRCCLKGFAPGQNYTLRVSYFGSGDSVSEDFCLSANGCVLYQGKPYGGRPDPAFDAAMLAPGYHSRSYDLPAALLPTGCLTLELREPRSGVMLSEFWLKKA